MYECPILGRIAEWPFWLSPEVQQLGRLRTVRLGLDLTEKPPLWEATQFPTFVRFFNSGINCTMMDNTIFCFHHSMRWKSGAPPNSYTQFKTATARSRTEARSINVRTFAAARRPSTCTRLMGSGSGSNSSRTVCIAPVSRSGPI